MLRPSDLGLPLTGNNSREPPEQDEATAVLPKSHSLHPEPGPYTRACRATIPPLMPHTPIPLNCPKCGRPMQFLKADDPSGVGIQVYECPSTASITSATRSISRQAAAYPLTAVAADHPPSRNPNDARSGRQYG